MGRLVKEFEETNQKKLFLHYKKKENMILILMEKKFHLDKEDFIIDFDAQENFAVSKRDQYVVFISTSRNKEMMAKGLVKDVARRLQTLRKERGYNPTDILEVASILRFR